MNQVRRNIHRAGGEIHRGHCAVTGAGVGVVTNVNDGAGADAVIIPDYERRRTVRSGGEIYSPVALVSAEPYGVRIEKIHLAKGQRGNDTAIGVHAGFLNLDLG